MAMREHLVVKRQRSTDALLEALDAALDQVEAETKLLFIYDYTEEKSDEVTVHVYHEVNDPSCMATVVEDSALKLQYLVVQAEDRKTLSRAADSLRKHLPVVPLDELREQARAGDDPEALVRLAAAAAPAFDRPTFDLILERLRTGTGQVREAAAMAAGVTQWSQFTPELRKILAGEKDGTVRRLLEAAVATAGAAGGDAS